MKRLARRESARQCCGSSNLQWPGLRTLQVPVATPATWELIDFLSFLHPIQLFFSNVVSQLIRMHPAEMMLKLLLMVSWVLQCSATDLTKRSSSALVVSPSEYL